MSSYSSFDIANYFLSRSAAEGIPLTNLKLQKMVYLANGFYLALTDGEEPLLNERIETWPYGPVISNLYHSFKRFGNDVIPARMPISVELSNIPESHELSNLPVEVNFDPKARQALEFTWNAAKN